MQQPRRRKVMVVEDDAPLREILQVLLQEYPHDFIFAENGRHALELDTIHGPELIMVDLGLPDMSGLELGKELRRRRGSSQRLIAFTGYDSDDYREQARHAGFDDFYLKPMELDAMERTFAKIFAEPA
jgi:CheY-like chemotaxis protein